MSLKQPLTSGLPHSFFYWSASIGEIMSRTAPYFPFYPDDWLDDENIFDMGLECEGAYIRLLAAMWKRDGFIPDSPVLCCNVLRCGKSKWGKIREQLINFGVIKSIDNQLFNERLTKELQIFNKKCKKNSENANKRWSQLYKTVPKKPNEINESGDAVASVSQCHTDTDTDTDKDKRLIVEEKSPTLISKLPTHKFSDRDLACAQTMYQRILDVAPKTKEPDFEKWAVTIRLMRERDKIPHDEIWKTFLWANKDEFWKLNILSPDKLRKQFHKLDALQSQQPKVKPCRVTQALDATNANLEKFLEQYQ